MRFEEVARVLDALDSDGVRHWVGGGWGVAVLVGRQTREHRDLDLAVDAVDLEVCLKTLELLGYRCETDWLPVRVEYSAPGLGWVDVHPVAFDDSGHGRQQDLDGGHVDYPPGAADPIHRHNAHSFVYVLEGSIVMQVRGSKEVTLTAGQTFYEGPGDIHTVGRNASQTRPARFLVVLIKPQGAPALIPAK